MIGYRISDYSGPRHKYTSNAAEMPKRCCDRECRLWSEADCASCGEPLCDEHSYECEECGSGPKYCLGCTALVDDLRNCHRHTMVIPASELIEEEIA